MKNKTKKIFLVFILFSILFSILQFTVPNIIGFDGYFNIKAAELIKQQGLIKNFIWIENSILSDNFADVQFLFKIILIPFTFFSLTIGAKIASIIFAALCFTIFYWFLIENKIRYAFFFTLLYLISSVSLMNRFLLTRPMPLAISFILLTIYFIQKRKYLFLGILSFIFVWLYSGFIIQLFIILIYIIVDKLFSKRFNYKLALYTFGGAFFGIVINPYFPNNISFLYTQIFQVNLLANLYNVEWKPWTFIEFLKNNFLILFYLILSLIILIKDKKINKNRAFYFSLTIIFLIFTIKTRRMQEFFAPFSVITLGFFLNDYLNKINNKNLLKYLKIVGILFVIIFSSLNISALRKDILNNDFIHNYDNCTEWMKNNIEKNSLIFNNAYAFPYLFSKNSDLRYTHGLDLTYSFLYNEEQFKGYMEILQGTTKENIDLIKNDYKPDYVFSGKIKQDIQLFNYVVKNKENYKAVYEDEWCAVLEVK